MLVAETKKIKLQINYIFKWIDIVDYHYLRLLISFISLVVHRTFTRICINISMLVTVLMVVVMMMKAFCFRDLQVIR